MAENMILRDKTNIRTKYGKNVGIIRQGIKAAMINFLRALMSKVDTVQGQMDIVSQKLETGRKTKRNARDKKCCKRKKRMPLMASYQYWIHLSKQYLR